MPSDHTQCCRTALIPCQQFDLADTLSATAPYVTVAVPRALILILCHAYHVPRRLQEVLIRYGVDRSMPQYNASSDADITELLKDPKHWPRDTDIPSLRHEPYFPGRARRARQQRHRQ